MDLDQNGIGIAAQRPERRSALRLPLDEASVFVIVGHSPPQQARLVDLSLEGCRLRAHDAFLACPGLSVEVFFRLKGVPFRFAGVLQWAGGDNLLGIHFVNVLPRRIEELAAMIAEIRLSRASLPESANLFFIDRVPHPSAASGAEKFAPRQRRETSASDAAQTQQATRPAEPNPSQQAPQQTVGTFAHRERRRQSRQPLDTSATILLVNVGSELRGHILDLSLSGCRIRTDEHFPVGIYTRVETEFRAAGLPFRLGGVVQVIHDRNTVGIRFLDLSDRKRQQVLELIGEIQQFPAAQAAPNQSALE
ncbi:MAG: PilZ domain-containing protein [Terracidiphilus sp.]